MPTTAEAGSPDRSGVMSAPVTATDVVAVLLAEFGSFPAPVVPVSVAEPTVVGVPETVHVIAAPAATVAGGVGAHEVLNPAGKPLIAHVAPVAASAGDAAFEHVNVPL